MSVSMIKRTLAPYDLISLSRQRKMLKESSEIAVISKRSKEEGTT